MYAAILAGGSGTRLWPRSRQLQPKQFADITGVGRTMIQATADRLQGLVDDDQLYVVTGA
ncbi:MAG: sugar phosphate nucleotidyltransferase, partial [Chloroflexi bacterium]|nr:sugar phosphate nucleotidyltransferase [Chloroflexota bacterium]